MANDKDVERVWTLIKKIGFCMLSTRDGDDIRARPMAPHISREENAIYFLTDVDGHKDDDIRRNPQVGLTFADAAGQKYVSLTGRAEVSNDRSKIKELWSTPAKAWWSSPDDPSIRVLRVTLKDAQYWDSPGTTLSYVKMVAAAMTDTRPEVGKSAKVKALDRSAPLSRLGGIHDSEAGLCRSSQAGALLGWPSPSTASPVVPLNSEPNILSASYADCEGDEVSSTPLQDVRFTLKPVNGACAPSIAVNSAPSLVVVLRCQFKSIHD
jgi:general stress protein 26